MCVCWGSPCGWGGPLFLYIDKQASRAATIPPPFKYVANKESNSEAFGQAG